MDEVGPDPVADAVGVLSSEPAAEEVGGPGSEPAAGVSGGGGVFSLPYRLGQRGSAWVDIGSVPAPYTGHGTLQRVVTMTYRRQPILAISLHRISRYHMA